MKKIIIILALVVLAGCVSDCGEECYNNAVKENNAEYCEDIKGSLKDACILRVAQNTNNIELCNNLEGNTKDQCINHIAINQSKEELCNLLKFDGFSDTCLKHFAEKNNDFPKCENITDTNRKIDCQYNIAIKTNFLNCNPIADKNKQNKCFFYHAYKDQKSKNCNMAFGDVPGKMICYKKVARLSMNQSICKNIEFTQILNDCNNMFINGTLKESENPRREKDLAKYV